MVEPDVQVDFGSRTAGAAVWDGPTSSSKGEQARPLPGFMITPNSSLLQQNASFAKFSSEIDQRVQFSSGHCVADCR